METDRHEAVGPLQAPWPSPLSADFMSERQWEVYYALLDGAMPAFTSQSEAGAQVGDRIVLPDAEFERVLDQAVEALPKNATDLETSRDDLRAFLEYRIAADAHIRQDSLAVLFRSSQRDALGTVLKLLTTRPGSLLLTGYWTPINAQPAHIRHAVMKSWSTSRLPPLRLLAKMFGTLAHKATAVTSPLFHRMVGYTDTPRDWHKAEGYDFRFIQVPAGSDVHTIETDVVIVGSGCGGAVAAKNIATAGRRVLVVDKAYHYPPSYFPMPQVTGLHHLFDNGGVYLTETAASILAGSAWGGGGTVNWSVSLKTQKFVREEWAAAGMPFFNTPAYDECLDRVCDFMGASTDGIRHNHANDVLLQGSKKLGFTAREAPQNTGGQQHYCGQCHLGCGSAGKKGPAVSWLPDAGRAGAEFMEGFTMEKVIFDEDGKTAIGVEGEWASRRPGEHEDRELIQRRVRIRAKKVIISAGSLRSPLLLMNSGIENAHLGKNLHIHPCNLVTATYEEDTRPWEGGIITSYNSEFENQDGKGHGVKLEPTCMVPYASYSTFPWTDGLESRMRFLKSRRSNSFIVLTRDRDGGQVTREPRTGGPLIDYTASDFDREHTLEGVQAMAKICYVTGATEIQPHLPGLAPFLKSQGQQGESQEDGRVKDPEFTDAAFAAWLRRVRQVGNKAPLAMWTSAHQMGTCRMGRSEEDGVVDGRGRVWGREGLYVADASVFPSASGVNPMITVMAISDWISRGLVEDWNAAAAAAAPAADRS